MRSRSVIGNRLALVGAIVYLLEFFAIIPAGDIPAPPGASADAVVTLYADKAGALALMASWLSFVLLGRIAFAAGVRDAIRQSPRQIAVADLAFGAMIVSVLLEIVAYGVAGATAHLASHGGDPGVVVGLDRVVDWVSQIIYAPLGVFTAASGFAMLRSDLFPKWICWLGAGVGTIITAYGAVAGPIIRSTGSAHDFGEAITGLGVAGFWVWMLATGIFLFRHADRQMIRGGDPV